MTRIAGVVVAALLWAGTVRVEAETCAEEVAALRDHLEVEHRRAKRWNTAWAIAYGTVAVAQFAVALAEYKPFGTFDDKFRDSMIVGGAKATIGVGARVVVPLRVRRPPAGNDVDPCSQLAALRDTLADGGKRELRSFYLNHLGGLAVNLTGATILWTRHDLKTAALSFGSGVAAGILAAYTQPRRSWHAWRERRGTWRGGVAPVVGAESITGAPTIGLGVGVHGSW